ncbi:EI24 domain-containing protein tank isoform X2 [Oratosquilla oratoria]|uniref:EI24 domain-containing protein tank isoform X2 n=1 Tax=Oratosquilla oratoria TaxID=337810 RepID=UPI003F75BD8F
MALLYGILRGIKDSLRGFYLILNYDNEVRRTDKPRQTPTRELTTLGKRRAAQQVAEKKQKQASHREQKLSESEPGVLKRFIECCTLNGVVFIISLLIFDYLVLPTLEWILWAVLQESGGSVWSYARPALSTLFSLLWALPLFIISRIINAIWFQDIADSAYRQKQGRPMLMPGTSKPIADMFFSIVIELFFLIQANMLMFLPIVGVGYCLSVVHMALLNALYAFEYKWFNMGWELHKRLSFIEEHWPYFMGFGLPLAIITMYPASTYISGGLFSVLFPIFIISANEAEPVMNTSPKLPWFAMVVKFNNRIFHKSFAVNPP